MIVSPSAAERLPPQRYGRADGAGTDTDLDGIGTCPDKVFRSFGSRNVPGDYFNVREFLFQVLQGIDDGLGMPMRRIYGNDINTRLDQQFSPARALSPTPMAAPTRRRPSCPCRRSDTFCVFLCP